MGKHHRKWFIDEPIAANKRVEEMMDDLESSVTSIHSNPYKVPKKFRPEHLKRMGVTMSEGGEDGE